jgi:hypothetical protein
MRNSHAENERRRNELLNSWREEDQYEYYEQTAAPVYWTPSEGAERRQQEAFDRQRREDEAAERMRRESFVFRQRQEAEQERQLAEQRARYDQLCKAISLQLNTIALNQGWFGTSKKLRKEAQSQLATLQTQLAKDFPNGRP